MTTVNIFHNVSDDNWFGYKPGQPLVWVFSYEIPAGVYADLTICEAAFGQFNNGSGSENPDYFKRRLRSLSTGDVVVIDGKRAYSCDSVGWSVQDMRKMRFLAAAQADAVIRERYGIGKNEQLMLTVPLPD